MKTFKQYFFEQEEDELSEKLQTKIEELKKPEKIEEVINQFKAKDLDDLIEKLENDSNVKKVLQSYEKMKDNVQENVIGDAFSGLTSLLKTTYDSVVNTVGHILGGFSQNTSNLSKANYAAALLLTFGLSPLLLGLGAPAELWAGPIVGGITLGSFALEWFGKNFLEPILKKSEQ